LFISGTADNFEDCKREIIYIAYRKFHEISGGFLE
jgi:hypothetical protein